MPIKHSSTIHLRPRSRSQSGFTLVEVLIAGGILLLVLTSLMRISVQSITSGRNRIERDKIESEIHNNIQLIQQADAKLTLDAMPVQERRSACLNPAAYLKQQLEKEGGIVSVPAPALLNIDGQNPIARLIELSSQPGITVITYQFDAPENAIGVERRIVELNPNFQTRCILE